MFSGLENPSHLLILGVILLLVFGPKRLPELGRSLGGGIRGFKKSIAGEDTAPAADTVESPPDEAKTPAA